MTKRKSKKEDDAVLIVEVPRWLKELLEVVKERTGIPYNMLVRKALIKFLSPYRKYIEKGEYDIIIDEVFKHG